MPNFFDQFDEAPQLASPNFFDQFDEVREPVERQQTPRGLDISAPSTPPIGEMLKGLIPRRRTPEQREEAIETFSQIPQQVLDAAASRPAIQGVGGVTGAALGSPLGPLGVLGGGALGVAAGDSLASLSSAAGLRPEDAQQPQTMQQALTQPFMMGAEDAMFSAGLTGAGGVLKHLSQGVKSGLLNLAGARTPEAEATRRLAAEAGVELGGLQASDRGAAKGVAKVLGVFPFVGTPIRKAQESAAKQVDKAMTGLLNDLAPTSTLSELGVDMTKKAARRFEAFRRASGSLYEVFEQNANNLSTPDVFPTDPIRRAARQALDPDGQITLLTGDEMPKVGSKVMDRFVENLAQLPDHLTIKQIRRLQRDLEQATGTSRAQGFNTKQAGIIRGSLEDSINTPNLERVAAEEAEELIRSLRTANEFFSKNSLDFETATARKFGRVDKNIFRPKFFQAGSREADEAFQAVFNANSEEAIRTLKKLNKGPVYRRAVRRYLDDAVSKSTIDGTLISGERFANNLGLNDPSRRRILKTMLEDTPVTLKRLDDMAKIMKAVESVEVPDVSRFIQRRAVLGGAKTAAGAITVGAITSDPMVNVGILLATRKASDIISNPRVLAQVKRGVDTRLPNQVRNEALFRAMRMMGDIEDEQD